MNELQKAVLKTLAYADIFSYPLTLKEIYLFLIAPLKKNYSLAEIAKGLKALQLKSFVQSEGEYFFLKDRQKIVGLRQKRDFYSGRKLNLAVKIARWLKLIPFIKAVGVTGNLAMKNADKNDDVDLLVITGKKRIWLTRLLTNLLIEIVSRRRRPQDKEVEDKICLNMFLDEDHLVLADDKQNLFTAHEVCQLKILWQKGAIYKKFLKENQWFKKFLPNWKI